MIKPIGGWYLILLLSACSDTRTHTPPAAVTSTSEKVLIKKADTTLPGKISSLESALIEKKLVNIHSLDTSIRVSLLYATDQNFLHKILYTNLNACYLPCEVALKLCNAQFFLKQQFPDYSIIVFDAVRPLHIQQQMWDELKMPEVQKINYLAHPSSISLHNYGAAVDVGLIGTNHILVEMGTAFDFFGELSEPRKELDFLKDGSLTQEAYNNRVLLRSVMKKAGFTPITSEWWHFNATNKTDAALRFELIP